MVKAARVEGVESVNSKHGHTKLSPLLNRPSKTIELDGYTLGDYLASGGCGTVMLCTKHNSEMFLVSQSNAMTKKHLLK